MIMTLLFNYHFNFYNIQVVRQDLLRWLKRESETRGATILYATHIFDGLDDWPTHLHYLCDKVSIFLSPSCKEFYFRATLIGEYWLAR